MTVTVTNKSVVKAARSTPKRRVILYARVSKDDREGLSPSGQLAGMRRWAERERRQVVGEYRDDGIGASRFSRGQRAQWQLVMDAISAGQTDELAVRQISRSTRDRAVWAALIAACIDNHVKIVVDGKVHDPADPEDGFMLDLQASLAVREAGNISKITSNGKQEAASLGRPAGNLNFGYRSCVTRSGRGRGRKSVGRRDPLMWDFEAQEPRRMWLADGEEPYLREVDPDTGPVFREIVTRLLDVGESAESIVRDLIRRDIPTTRGGTWTSGNLARMVIAPAYLGKRVYRGRVLDVPALWPPLMTDDEYLRLTRKFGSPERDKYRHTSLTRHLGTGIYRCGREGCDGRMRVVIGASVGRPDRYDCRVCHKVARQQDPVDRAVEQLVIARLKRPDILALLSERADDPAAKAAAADAVKLQARIREYENYAATADEPPPPDEFARIIAGWRERLAKAEERAQPPDIPNTAWQVAGPEAERRWNALEIKAKRAIVAALFDVVILPAGQGHWRFDPNLIEVRWRGAGS